MFKRSGALSGTRRSSKKPSPLPKRTSRKDVDVSEKSSGKISSKKSPLVQQSEHEQGAGKCPDDAVSSQIERAVIDVSQAVNVESDCTHDSTINEESKESVSSSTLDSIQIISDVSVSEETCSESKEPVGIDEDCSTELANKEEERSDLEKKEKDLDTVEDKENGNILETKSTSPEESKNLILGACEEGAKGSDVLLIDAEDLETFQDLSMNPNVVVERDVEVAQNLELKSSDTSGLVTGGVISLQYPDDDARSLDSVRLDELKTEEDPKESQVCIRSLGLVVAC